MKSILNRSFHFVNFTNKTFISFQTHVPRQKGLNLERWLAVSKSHNHYLPNIYWSIAVQIGKKKALVAISHRMLQAKLHVIVQGALYVPQINTKYFIQATPQEAALITYWQSIMITQWLYGLYIFTEKILTTYKFSFLTKAFPRIKSTVSLGSKITSSHTTNPTILCFYKVVICHTSQDKCTHAM